VTGYTIVGGLIVYLLATFIYYLVKHCKVFTRTKVRAEPKGEGENAIGDLEGSEIDFDEINQEEQGEDTKGKH
jgi:hypothetical protein